jgi:hypothetical protein
MAMKIYAATEELLETTFHMKSMPRLHNVEQWDNQMSQESALVVSW